MQRSCRLIVARRLVNVAEQRLRVIEDTQSVYENVGVAELQAVLMIRNPVEYRAGRPCNKSSTVALMWYGL